MDPASFVAVAQLLGVLYLLHFAVCAAARRHQLQRLAWLHAVVLFHWQPIQCRTLVQTEALFSSRSTSYCSIVII